MSPRRSWAPVFLSPRCLFLFFSLWLRCVNHSLLAIGWRAAVKKVAREALVQQTQPRERASERESPAAARSPPFAPPLQFHLAPAPPAPPLTRGEGGLERALGIFFFKSLFSFASLFKKQDAIGQIAPFPSSRYRILILLYPHRHLHLHLHRRKEEKKEGERRACLGGRVFLTLFPLVSFVGGKTLLRELLWIARPGAFGHNIYLFF